MIRPTSAMVVDRARIRRMCRVTTATYVRMTRALRLVVASRRTTRWCITRIATRVLVERRVWSKGGTEYCSGGGPSGTCVGQTTPVSEVCDGLDNDCDGVTDDGVLNTYYRDEDSDGYGNPNITIQACSPPPGYVAAAGDCVDSGSAKNSRWVHGYRGPSEPNQSGCEREVQRCRRQLFWWYRRDIQR